MKKVWLIFLIFLTSWIPSSSQEVELGIKAGMNAGVLIGPIEDGDKGKPAIGPNVGLFGIISVNSKISLQLEANYCYTGVSFKRHELRQNYPRDVVIAGILYPDLPTTYEADVEGKIDLHYADFPFQMLWNFNNKWALNFGPRIAFLIKGDLEGTAYNVKLGDNGAFGTIAKEPFPEHEKESFKKDLRFIDAGFTIGANYRFNNRWHLGLDASNGFTSVNLSGEFLPDKYYNFFINTSIGVSLF